MRIFAPWLHLQLPVYIPQSLLVLGASFMVLHQVFKCVYGLPAQPLALEHQPIIESVTILQEESGEKIATVQPGGLKEAGMADRAVFNLAMAVRAAGIH